MSWKNAKFDDVHQKLSFCGKYCENFKRRKCYQFSVLRYTMFQEQAKAGSKSST